MDEFDLPDLENVKTTLLVNKNILLVGLGAFGLGMFLGWKLAGGTQIEAQLRTQYADVNPFLPVDEEPNPKATEPLPPVTEVPNYTEES